MSFLKVFVIILTTLLVFLLNSKIANADPNTYNLIQNPSFEEGELFPSNWHINNNKFCNTSITTPTEVDWNQNNAKTGLKSLGFKNVYYANNQENPAFTRIVSNVINIPYAPTTKYMMGGAAKGAPGNKLRASLQICFYNSLGTVLYSNSILSIYPLDNQFWYGIQSGPSISFNIPTNTASLQIAISVACYAPNATPNICSGTLWFDDISFQPVGTVTAHKFEDKNKNGIQDADESNLIRYGVAFYKDFDCVESKTTMSGWTDQNGNITLKDIPFGNYSVKENFEAFPLNPPNYIHDIRQLGWINTTPICQNISLIENNPFSIINLGLLQTPPFPYFSQKDPAWGGLEYDSAILQGPFFCGTTLAGCGCAVTSSAMLLKYHGATKSPTGEDTNPKTLNSWLKNNNGYAFGALKWNSIAAYSVKANSVFGTQKIKFNGVGTANNFSLLDQDLNSDKPAILEEPGHFVVATDKQNATYNINDPYFENRKTLASYSNNFTSSRRFEKTSTDLSAIYIQSPAPTDIFLTNSLGLRVGRDPETGIIHNEIPDSFYFTETDLTDPTSLSPTTTEGINTLIILTPITDSYNIQTTNPTHPLKIEFSTYDEQGNIGTYNISETATSNATENFILNYSPEYGSTIDITKIIEIDIKPESTLNEINLESNGVITVAVLSNENFNALNIEFDSAELGGAGETHNKLHPTYVNGDLFLDVILHFRTQNINLTDKTTSLCLEGETTDREKVKGCDLIIPNPG